MLPYDVSGVFGCLIAANGFSLAKADSRRWRAVDTSHILETPTSNRDDRLLLATCRADPADFGRQDHLPLAAGHYQLLLVDRAESQPPATRAHHCNCHKCTARAPFTVRAEAALPTGDIILVTHGFECTEATGIMMGYNIRDALGAWGLPLSSASVSEPPAAPRVMAFTWPCEHSLFPGYLEDKQAIARFAAFSLANLLTDLRRAEPSRRIHFVAHSMGCFLTLKALNMLAVLHGVMAPTPVIDELIWLAPDVNADALERSTPAAPRLHSWRHPGQRPPFSRIRRVMYRPQPEEPALTHMDIAAATQWIDTNVQPPHPLDGYGYAALDAVDHLTIYSSLRDEAMWVAPWANHSTEEAGSAAGSMRLGWNGPLHPQLALIPDADAHYRERHLTLADCTPVVYEHGDYFFNPVTQRDFTAQIARAQLQAAARLPAGQRDALTQAAMPPPERRPLAAWHPGKSLQYPPTGTPVPPGLELYTLARPARDGTKARPSAPPTQGIPWYITVLWRSPLAYIAQVIIAFWRWYYHV